MYYYRLTKDGKYVDLYTSDKKVADRNKCTLTTTEEIVMQGDKRGYVLASEYLSLDTRLDDLQKEYDSCVSLLKDYMTEAQLIGDDELIQEIRDDYFALVNDFEEQSSAIIDETMEG